MENPFYYLRKTIRLLIVDDDRGTREILNEFFNEQELFSVSTVSSSSEADIFLKNSFFHVCLLDLGLWDRDNDQFFLLRKYRNTQFIIISGSLDLQHGFSAAQLGARYAVKKPFQPDNLLHIVSETILKYVIVRDRDVISDQVIYTARRVLLEKEPSSISDWARLTGIDETYLRRKWNNWYNIQPKISFYLFKIYHAALKYLQTPYYAPGVFEDLSMTFKKLEYQYMLHKKEFEAILSDSVNNEMPEDDVLICDMPRMGKMEREND